MLMTDFIDHRELIRRPLSQQRIQQQVLALVVVVQHGDDEVDVVAQELHSVR